MVNVTIDGKTIEVPEGTTVLKAAQMAGVKIPVLCDHPKLAPYGACRLCLVDVEGARTLQPACTLPVTNKMVVRTTTDKVHAARRFVLTLIFSERNHFCPYCQVSGGDCELQNAALGEGMANWPLQPNYQPYPMDASHPHFVLEHNRCILCRRCVRACGELVGNFTLGFEERGARSFLVADLGVPMGESSCISCGTCVQVCPTGALIDRGSAYMGKEIEMDSTKSICIGCSVGCGIEILTRANNPVRVKGDWDGSVNGGVLCEIGRYKSIEDKRERIRVPLVRKNGALKAATWDEALDAVAAKLAGKSGDGVAAVASTRLPAEALYAFQQLFAGKLGSSMVTSTEEGVSAGQQAKLAAELGKPFEGSIDDLKQADCFVLVGSNLVDNHQVAGFFVKRSAPLGVPVIVIDPAQNPMDKLADVQIKAPKSSEADVIQALAAAVLALSPVPEHAEAMAKELAELAARTGLTADVYQKAAAMLTGSKKPVFVYGKSIAAGPMATLKKLVDLVTLVDGKALSTKGQANSVTAIQYGLEQQFALNEQQVVVLAMGDDTPSERLVQRLEKAPFTVVMSAYSSKLTANADVVLPVEMWAEQEGTFVNLGGKIQKTVRAVKASEEIWASEAVLKALAVRLGYELDSEWKEALSRRTAPVVLA